MKKSFRYCMLSVFLLPFVFVMCNRMVVLPMNSGENTAQNETAAETPADVDDTEKDQKVAYSYIGRVGGLSATKANEDVEPEHDSDNESKVGYIPELTIDSAGPGMSDIASRFGYRLAAITSDQIIGIVEGNRIEPISQDGLQQFAQRARATLIPDESKQLFSRLTEHYAADVRAVYLVPAHVENKFIETQMQAIRRAGYYPETIRLVRARYSGSGIVVTELVHNDGTIERL